MAKASFLQQGLRRALHIKRHQTSDNFSSQMQLLGVTPHIYLSIVKLCPIHQPSSRHYISVQKHSSCSSRIQSLQLSRAGLHRGDGVVQAPVRCSPRRGLLGGPEYRGWGHVWPLLQVGANTYTYIHHTFSEVNGIAQQRCKCTSCSHRQRWS